MKQGISIERTYDLHDRLIVRILKRRGRLTLEEVSDLLRLEGGGEWSGWYAVLLNCTEGTIGGNGLYDSDDPKGDAVDLYEINEGDDCPICGKFIPPFQYCPSCGAKWSDAGQIAKLMQNGPTLMIAHNAQFDACFLRGLLRGQKVGRIDWLDSLTVYKDRRAYPHKLANAIIAYDLTGKVQNSHRAIDDVLALFEVLKAMDDEREDLGSYVNLFGYNPKYGVSGRRIVGVRYEPQSFSKGLTRPEQTLPARVARR